jgi:bacteriocin-like protein
MDKKNLISQALQLVNLTTNPNVLARLSEKTSDVQELSEEALSQVYGGAVEQKHSFIVYCRQPD